MTVRRSIASFSGLLTAAAVILVSMACGGGSPQAKSNSTPTPTPDCARLSTQPLPFKQVTLSYQGRTATVVAESAETEAQRETGLMCRMSVPDGTGMLFIYNRLTVDSFWMYNTYVPLDILYTDRNGNVVSGSKMSPCPRKGREADADWQHRCLTDADKYKPAGQYLAALELPAGWLSKQGFGNPGEKAIKLRWAN